MFAPDDRETAKLGDRIIAAAIAGVCGFMLGWVIAIVAVRLFQSGAWIVWVPTIALGLYGFRAPNRSRDMLTEFWSQILNYFSSRR